MHQKKNNSNNIFSKKKSKTMLALFTVKKQILKTIKLF